MWAAPTSTATRHTVSWRTWTTSGSSATAVSLLLHLRTPRTCLTLRDTSGWCLSLNLLPRPAGAATTTTTPPECQMPILCMTLAYSAHAVCLVRCVEVCADSFGGMWQSPHLCVCVSSSCLSTHLCWFVDLRIYHLSFHHHIAHSDSLVQQKCDDCCATRA